MLLVAWNVVKGVIFEFHHWTSVGTLLGLCDSLSSLPDFAKEGNSACSPGSSVFGNMGFCESFINGAGARS